MPELSAPDRLETARLVLRPRRVEEEATYRRLWTERDPRVPARRRIDAQGRPSIEDVADHLQAEVELVGLKVLAVELRETGEVIGYCGLFSVDYRPPDEPELAYELLVEAHGHGYATEAAQSVVFWARQAGCPRLWADVWAWNTASRRVLAKLGFRETGVVEPGPYGDSLQTVLDL